MVQTLGNETPLQQLQQPGDNWAWWVREGVECTAGAALWGRRRERGGEERKERPGLSHILSFLPRWRQRAGVDFLEKFRADMQYLIRPVRRKSCMIYLV